MTTSAVRYLKKSEKPKSLTMAIIAANAFLLVLMLAFGDAICAAPTSTVSFICSIVALSEIALLVLTSPKGMWSIPACYLFVFILFHFGLVFVNALGIDLEPFLPSWYSSDWFFTPETAYGIYLCAIGMIACVSGIFVARFMRKSSPKMRETKGRDISEYIGPLGFLLVISSIGLWIYSILENGSLLLLLCSYSTYLDTVNGSMANAAFFGIGLGLIFSVISKPCIWRKMGIGLFVLWAMVAFPLGLRGEILFPSMTALAVTASRKIPLKPINAIFAAIILLSLIAFVKEGRSNGLGNVDWGHVVLNPVNAVAEMGVSLKPVSATVRWLQDGDPLLWGAGYWAPFDRALIYVLPGWDRLEAEDDFRLSSLVVTQRESSIGFSVIAEAYRNLDMGGVILIMFLVGLVLQILDSWPATGEKMALAGIILFPMMMHIRNPVSILPFQMIVAFVVLRLYTLFYTNLARAARPRRRTLSTANHKPWVGIS